MKIQSEGFETLMVLTEEKHQLLLNNLDFIIQDCIKAACIKEIWVNDIILAFEASGYRIVRDDTFSKVRMSIVAKKQDIFDVKQNGCNCYRCVGHRTKKPILASPEELFNMRADAMRESETKWIFESPDGGETVSRRPFGEYDTPQEQVKSKPFDKSQETLIR